MHTKYADILSRISEEPSWFDELAVPRYGDFDPDAVANVYAREAVLVLAACQFCGRHFRLAITRPYFKDDPDVATAVCHRGLHYGDPPNVDCCSAGPSTTVVELEVLEYWWRVSGSSWKREVSFEVGVVSNVMSDDPRYEAYYDVARNPEYPLSFGSIPKEPKGAQFQELVTELLTRYPAATREAAEAALRSVWAERMFSRRCFQLAEDALAEFQWPAVSPNRGDT
ncbi:hypothetical protein [Bradyrhizobium sp. USDA 3364]